MTNTWPDPDAKSESLDINDILDSELAEQGYLARPTDKTVWTPRAAPEPVQSTPEPPASKAEATITATARFIAVLCLAIVVLLLTGAIIATLQWIIGMF